jgi:glycosyltransferase involved in cell wall biosynthesis
MEINMDSVEVSVIISVYNTEKYLRQCLDSVKNQTLKNIEIICVNDGSQDGSLDILNEYAEKDGRFKIFTKKNEGLGAASARNLGLEKAHGKYISILDSDDFFELNMLESAVKKAEECQTDIVVFGGYVYDNNRGELNKELGILNENVIPEKEVFSYRDCPNDIYQLTQGMAWNKLYRKSFLDKYNLRFQRIKYTDDAYFVFAHMVLAERIAVLREYLCYYRINTGENQTSGITNYPDSSYVPYVELKKFFEQCGVYEDIKQSFINCAVLFIRLCYDSINRYDVFEYLHNKLRDEIFDTLDIKDCNEDYFKDKKCYSWVKQVCNNSANELIFKAVRAYGSNYTTSILRFKFPFDKIKRGSKIALIGAGIMGRHYYSQIMLSRCCDPVCWVEKENKCNFSYIDEYTKLDEVEFDYAVIAYEQPKLINEAVLYLKNMGIPDENIIFGGNE